MSGLRILHVTPYYEQAWAYGGVPRVVASLTHGLAQRGHRVTVCATDAYEAEARLPAGARTAGAVELRVFPNLSNAAAYRHQLFLPLGLDRWLGRHAGEFDVAHLHACRNLPGALAARRLRLAGVPYLVSPHGTAPRLERRRLSKWIFDHTVGRRVLSDAHRVMAVSEAERSQLLSLGLAASRIGVLGNPVDLDEWKEPIEPGRFRRRFALPWKEVVLYLGKLTPRKQLDLLVRAFARLARPSVGLVIAGNDMGTGRALGALVAELGLGARTSFTGLLRGRERLEALTDADVVAYPSRHEVFGLASVEALLCGTPVVVSDDSGCGEVIAGAGGGRVVPEGDERALAAALSSVLDDPTRWRAAARAAAEKVRARFGAGVICERLEGCYREAVAR